MNAFDAFGEAHARREKPRKLPMAPVTEQDKWQVERSTRMNRFHRLVQEEQAVAYALPGGVEAQAIVRWASKMTPEDGDELLAKVRRLQPERLDKRLRVRLLADLDTAICRLRVRNGLAEIDDPIFDEPESVFQVLRRMLG
jgi:hypothetical protein